MSIFLWSFFFLTGGILVVYASLKFMLSPRTSMWLGIGILALTVLVILILSLVLRTIIRFELERRERIQQVVELLNDY